MASSVLPTDGLDSAFVSNKQRKKGKAKVVDKSESGEIEASPHTVNNRTNQPRDDVRVSICATLLNYLLTDPGYFIDYPLFPMPHRLFLPSHVSSTYLT